MNDEQLMDLLFGMGVNVTKETFIDVAKDYGFVCNAKKKC